MRTLWLVLVTMVMVATLAAGQYNFLYPRFQPQFQQGQLLKPVRVVYDTSRPDVRLMHYPVMDPPRGNPWLPVLIVLLFAPLLLLNNGGSGGGFGSNGGSSSGGGGIIVVTPSPSG